MTRSIIWVLLAGCWISSYATDARVIAMGRHDYFFMDEVSIFRNPANINIYPNMVYGSYGEYRELASDTVTHRTNRDPVMPFFGSIISYSLDQNSETRNQYPMVSFGAVFNRNDEMLNYITKGTDEYFGDTSAFLVPPTGKIDLLGGYVLPNGGMIGIGTYLAFQSDSKSIDGKDAVLYETSVYKGTIGVNWPIAKSANVEASLAGGILRSKGDTANAAAGRQPPQPDYILANNDLFVKFDARLFSALSILNGDFVPHFTAQRVYLDSERVILTDVIAGLGVNINIDKGFFWAGVEGIYKDVYCSDSIKTGIGGRVSFGIERSIWRDWFVIRVGGQKILLYNNIEMQLPGDNSTKGRWEENPVEDGSDKDLVSLGFGLNVENRLRVDFVAAEDIAYTFTNFISGPQHHLFTRVSATYSF